MLPSPLLREYAATRAWNTVDTRLLRSDRSLWDLEMLPTGPLVSRILGSVLILMIPQVSDAPLTFSLADGEPERREIRSAHSSLPRARSGVAAKGAGASGAQEGVREAAPRAPRAAERGVPAARAAGALFSGDRGVLVLGGG
jgi:hypothetical protein